MNLEGVKKQNASKLNVLTITSQKKKKKMKGNESWKLVNVTRQSTFSSSLFYENTKQKTKLAHHVV